MWGGNPREAWLEGIPALTPASLCQPLDEDLQNGDAYKIAQVLSLVPRLRVAEIGWGKSKQFQLNTKECVIIGTPAFRWGSRNVYRLLYVEVYVEIRAARAREV